MPIEVACTSCRGVFHAPDSAGGKRAVCPTCGASIDIPTPEAAAKAAAAASMPEVITVTGDRKPCPLCGELIATSAIKCRFCGEILDPTMKGMIRSHTDWNGAAWQKVRSGVATIYYCTLVIFGAVVVFGAMAGVIAAVGAAEELYLIPIGLGGLVALGAGIGSLVGQVLCVNVPEESGARGMMIGALVCMVLNFFLAMVGAALQAQAIQGVGNLVSMAGYVLFMLFIRQCAIYLGDPQLASSTVRFLIFSVVAFVGMIAIGVMSFVLIGEGGIAVLVIFGIISLLIYAVWYVRLLKGLMTAIDARMNS